MADYFQYPIYARDPKEIPDWLKTSQNWQNAVPVDKLHKHQLKVKMCCSKCEEKVVEEIREVHGVFDVRGERFNSKVVVVSSPANSDSWNVEHEVLKRARKVDKKAKFVELDAKEKPKTEEQKKKEAEEKKKKEAEERKKKEEQLKKDHEAALANYLKSWKPLGVPLYHWPGGPTFYGPDQAGYYPGEFFYREYTQRHKEEEEKKKKGKEEEEKKNKKKEQEAPVSIPGFWWNPNGPHWNGPYLASQFHSYHHPEDQLREPWYAPRYHYQPLPFQPERNEFSQPYFFYH